MKNFEWIFKAFLSPLESLKLGRYFLPKERSPSLQIQHFHVLYSLIFFYILFKVRPFIEPPNNAGMKLSLLREGKIVFCQ